MPTWEPDEIAYVRSGKGWMKCSIVRVFPAQDIIELRTPSGCLISRRGGSLRDRLPA